MDEQPSRLLPVIEALDAGPLRDKVRHGTYESDGLQESFEIDFPQGGTLEVTFDGKEHRGVLRYWDAEGEPAGIDAFAAFRRADEEFGEDRLRLQDTDAVMLATRYIERLHQLLSGLN